MTYRESLISAQLGQHRMVHNCAFVMGHGRLGIPETNAPSTNCSEIPGGIKASGPTKSVWPTCDSIVSLSGFCFSDTCRTKRICAIRRQASIETYHGTFELVSSLVFFPDFDGFVSRRRSDSVFSALPNATDLCVPRARSACFHLLYKSTTPCFLPPRYTYIFFVSSHLLQELERGLLRRHGRRHRSRGACSV